MSMEKVLGKTLATGVTATGLTGVHEQTATRSAKGETKVYKDKDGKDIAVYTTDKHDEYSFEALIESSVEDKEIGATTTIGSVTGVVTQWDVVEKNDDVKLVRGAIRTFPDIQGDDEDDDTGGNPPGGGEEED